MRGNILKDLFIAILLLIIGIAFVFYFVTITPVVSEDTVVPPELVILSDRSVVKDNIVGYDDYFGDKTVLERGVVGVSSKTVNNLLVSLKKSLKESLKADVFISESLLGISLDGRNYYICYFSSDYLIINMSDVNQYIVDSNVSDRNLLFSKIDLMLKEGNLELTLMPKSMESTMESVKVFKERLREKNKIINE